MTITDQILDLVGGRAEAEVVTSRAGLALTRFANSFIHQNVSDVDTTVRLRLHVDGRTASGTTNLTDPAALAAFVERTVAAARLCPPDETWPGLLAPTAPSGAGNHDPATADADPAVRAAAVRAFVDAGGGLETAGYCRTTDTETTYANTAGHRISGRSSSAAMHGVARLKGSDGMASWCGVSLTGLDGGRLGGVAARKARAGVDAVDLAPGRYEVVLEPTAVTDLLLMYAIYGFNAKQAAQGASFVVPGEAQFDRAVTVVDDPLGADAVGLPFDGEGTPSRTLPLITAGVSGQWAQDRRTARVAGVASTGHAPLAQNWGGGPTPANVSLAPGSVAPVAVAGPVADDSVGGLVAGVERGLLVTDLWYTRVLDPRSLVVTGLTRNGVWLIEDGVITSPVRNMRFTQSYRAALEPGAVLGVGAAATSLPIEWGVGAVRTPALRLASWNFSGGSAG